MGGPHPRRFQPGGTPEGGPDHRRGPLVHPHQANVRIIHAASDVLGFHRDVVYKNLERFGNTSGGSIPIALDELVLENQVKPGDLILTSGFGAGLNWGTALWRW